MIIIHIPSSLISWGKNYLLLKESLINLVEVVLGGGEEETDNFVSFKV